MTSTAVISQRRLWVLCGLSLVLLGFLAQRLVYLQVFRHEYYQAVASSQRQRAAELFPHRGTIYAAEDREKELFPIAVNTKQWIAYAVPREMKDPAVVAEQLAPALLAFHQRQRQLVTTIVATTGQNKNSAEPTTTAEPAAQPPADELAAVQEKLHKKFNQKIDPYEPFLKFYEVLDDEFKQYIEEKKLDGIVLEEKEVRLYPENSLAAHILGYVGWQDNTQVGRYGLEGFFEKTLSGNLGFLSSERDASGKLIGVAGREFQAARDGANIVLTIDRVVQSFIEEELRAGIEKYDAEGGNIIVMNPKTGAIVGMATYPTYNPNYYFAIKDPHTQVNPVVQDLFEPGSILKPVIMAAAINQGLVKPDTTMVDNGPVKVAEYTINTFDGKHHGRQTMTQILEQSNNIGMVWVGQQLGAEAMYDYLRGFGIGEKTGIELEGETQSHLPEPPDWNITTVATTSFGQGIALTPLQALNAINVIANNGQLMQPHLVARVQQSDGQEEITKPTVVRQVIAPPTASQVSAMLVSVIENGVAGLAKVPGYYLAGKTGTAQVPDERGKYSPDRKIISFVGYGPASDPQFSIMIKLDNPSGLSFASGTAAPMFRNVATKLLNYYQISPDYEAVKKPPNFKVPPQLPAPGQTGA